MKKFRTTALTLRLVLATALTTLLMATAAPASARAAASNSPAAQTPATPSRELSLAEVFSLAAKTDPSLQAGEARVREAQNSLSISKSAYFPTLDLGVVDSTGFPGSTGSTVGVFGLIASPFRSGAAAGVFSRLSVFDRERDFGVDVARGNLKSSEQRAAVLRQQAYQRVLQAFIEASRARAHRESWNEFAREIAQVVGLVKRLVRTGQHSPVSQFLVQDQAYEAEIKGKVFQERYQEALVRLALLVGLPADSFDCPPSSALDEKNLGFLIHGAVNPLIARAQADIEAARAQTSRSVSQNLPKIAAVASAGYMQNSRLVPEQNYAAAVGIDLPIFEGFRISNETQRARAALEERQKELEAVQLGVQESASRFDEDARASRLKLEILGKEKLNAIQALKLAQSRYLSYRGLLVDVREALRNLIRIETDINDAKANLILALGSKAILEGDLSP